MSHKTKCSATNKSGPWKGTPCCNVGKFEHKGVKYCAVHFGLAGLSTERDTQTEDEK
jgi:hypothetical protein